MTRLGLIITTEQVISWYLQQEPALSFGKSCGGVGCGTQQHLKQQQALLHFLLSLGFGVAD